MSKESLSISKQVVDSTVGIWELELHIDGNKIGHARFEAWDDQISSFSHVLETLREETVNKLIINHEIKHILTDITVIQSHRRKGLGRALLEHYFGLTKTKYLGVVHIFPPSTLFWLKIGGFLSVPPEITLTDLKVLIENLQTAGATVHGIIPASLILINSEKLTIIPVHDQRFSLLKL